MRERRSAFTLVEMLVALGIIVILATLAVLFLPTANEQTKAARGGELVQQWLLIAKQWALRDQAPRGVRLYVDTNNRVRDIVYIEQPDDFVVRGSFTIPGPTPQTVYATRKVGIGNFTVSGNPPVGAPTLPATAPYFWAFLDPNQMPNYDFTAGETNQADWPVQAGDYFQLKGGPVHRIQAVIQDQTTQKYTLLQLASAYPNALGAPFDSNTVYTDQYRIIRQPRRVRDQKALEMPKDIVIDTNQSRNLPAFTAIGSSPPISYPLAGQCDIVFAPNGAVIGAGAAADRIFLYVRDSSQDNVTAGSPTLIGINCRTGFISSYPVNADTSLGDAYYFTKDTRATGL